MGVHRIASYSHQIITSVTVVRSPLQNASFSFVSDKKYSCPCQWKSDSMRFLLIRRQKSLLCAFQKTDHEFCSTFGNWQRPASQCKLGLSSRRMSAFHSFIECLGIMRPSRVLCMLRDCASGKAPSLQTAKRKQTRIEPSH
jgi:hypothetical protein